MKKQLTAGFLGSGIHARFLMEEVSQYASIVAIHDVDCERAQNEANVYRARCYKDFQEMLEKENLDVLIVSVPPFAHQLQEIMAVEKGVHLFICKPVGLDLDQARRVNDAIQKSGIIHSVSYMMRYCEPIVQAKELLRTEKIGLVQAHMLTCYAYSQKLRDWYFKKEKSGGQLLVQSSHLFDIIRFLVGEITEVYAIGTKNIMVQTENYNIEDASVTTLKFENGAIGSIFSTVAMPAGFEEYMHFDILSEHYRIEYNLTDGRLLVTDNQGRVVKDGIMNGRDSIKVEVAAFFKAVETGDRSLIRTPYEDALKTMEVALLADKSMSLGKPILVQN